MKFNHEYGKGFYFETEDCDKSYLHTNSDIVSYELDEDHNTMCGYYEVPVGAYCSYGCDNFFTGVICIINNIVKSIECIVNMSYISSDDSLDEDYSHYLLEHDEQSEDNLIIMSILKSSIEKLISFIDFFTLTLPIECYEYGVGDSYPFENYLCTDNFEEDLCTLYDMFIDLIYDEYIQDETYNKILSVYRNKFVERILQIKALKKEDKDGI